MSASVWSVIRTTNEGRVNHLSGYPGTSVNPSETISIKDYLVVVRGLSLSPELFLKGPRLRYFFVWGCCTIIKGRFWISCLLSLAWRKAALQWGMTGEGEGMSDHFNHEGLSTSEPESLWLSVKSVTKQTPWVSQQKITGNIVFSWHCQR